MTDEVRPVPLSRVVWGAVAIVFLAMISGDPRVLVVALPLGLALGLMYLAGRRA